MPLTATMCWKIRLSRDLKHSMTLIKLCATHMFYFNSWFERKWSEEVASLYTFEGIRISISLLNRNLFQSHLLMRWLQYLYNLWGHLDLFTLFCYKLWDHTWRMTWMLQNVRIEMQFSTYALETQTL